MSPEYVTKGLHCGDEKDSTKYKWTDRRMRNGLFRQEILNAGREGTQRKQESNNQQKEKIYVGDSRNAGVALSEVE